MTKFMKNPKANIEKLFRRNYKNNRGERTDFRLYLSYIHDYNDMLEELYRGTREGMYLWSTHAYNVMNKAETLTQLDCTHKKLLTLQDNFNHISWSVLDENEKKEFEKYSDLLWKNILLNDNITCEINKIRRDYFFFDEIVLS